MLYDVILADPPWDFKVWNEDTGSGRSASSHYSTMTNEALSRLPIGGLASENCALFIWVVAPKLFEGIDKIWEAWGFKYKTKAFNWVKAKKSGFGFFTGMGYYTRANSEDCLLCVKGTMPVSVHDVNQVIYSPVREHSRKPDEQYGKIERLYPNMKYLELFARRKRHGWDVWGNEVESDIELGELT